MSTVSSVTRRGLRWFKSNSKQVLFNMAVAGAVGWVVNTYVLAGPMGGFQVANSDAAVTGRGSIFQGALFWGLLSTLIFSLLGYWRALGTRQFLRAIADIPSTLSRSIKGDKQANVHLIGGAGLTFATATLVSPWTAGILALALFAFLPTHLGQFLIKMVRRLWRTAATKFLPGRGRGAAPVSVLVALVGSAMALAASFLIRSDLLKVVIAVLLVATAALLQRRPNAPTAAIWLVGLSLAVVLAILRANQVLADDGGWAESCFEASCGVIDWITSDGSGTVIGYGGLGGIASSAGAALGSFAGSTFTGLPDGSAATILAPAGAAAGSTVDSDQSSKDDEEETETEVIGGQEAIDELILAGAVPDSPGSPCLSAASVDAIRLGGRIAGYAFAGQRVCPDGVGVIRQVPVEPSVQTGESPAPMPSENGDGPPQGPGPAASISEVVTNDDPDVSVDADPDRTVEDPNRPAAEPEQAPVVPTSPDPLPDAAPDPQQALAEQMPPAPTLPAQPNVVGSGTPEPDLAATPAPPVPLPPLTPETIRQGLARLRQLLTPDWSASMTRAGAVTMARSRFSHHFPNLGLPDGFDVVRYDPKELSDAEISYGLEQIDPDKILATIPHIRADLDGVARSFLSDTHHAGAHAALDKLAEVAERIKQGETLDDIWR